MSFYDTLSDEQLFLSIKEGDELAFNTLYQRYWQLLYQAAFRRLENGQQAEDIVQEVFIRLWTRKENLSIENVSSYLHTAVRYSVLSFFSRHKTTYAFYEPFEGMLGEGHSPEEHLMAKELLELAYAYAETLSSRKKQILLLHLKGSRSTKEIADILGITQKTVQNQLGTALQGLRRNLIPLIIAVLSLNG